MSKSLDDLSLPEVASFLRDMSFLIDREEDHSIYSDGSGPSEMLSRAKEALSCDVHRLCKRFSELEEW